MGCDDNVIRVENGSRIMPPTRQHILNFAEANYLTFPEARKRLLREYFLEELYEIKKDSQHDLSDVRISRLVKIIEFLVTELL